MSKIALSEGFSVIPEGTHIFQITEVTYKEEFGKMEVKLKTAKGQTHTERFNLMGKDGSMNTCMVRPITPTANGWKCWGWKSRITSP